MTKVTYGSTSPYYNTKQVNNYLEYLDYWSGARVLMADSDQQYTLQAKYERRPDLLSFDLYNTTGYWWIFAMRNPDKIKDPINDMRAGMTIYVPSANNLPKRSA